MQYKPLWAALAAACVWPVAAAETGIDPGRRVQELERRIEQLEQRQTPSRQGVQTPTAQPPGTSGVPRVTSGAFNPAISLILDGKLASFSQDPAGYALPGFSLAEEAGPGEEGFSLGESELVLTANVDDKFYGAFVGALSRENEFEIEEAYFETLALGGGFTLRGGRFFSGIGYLNPIHAHAWDFVDPPLVYRALLGGQYTDDGIQLRWVAPTALFLELGAEGFRGDAFPAGGAARSGKGTWTAFARIGGDIGVAHAWRAGVSRLDARAQDRASGDAAAPDLFSGDSKVTGVDFIWKWAPGGNPTLTNFKFQAEYWKRDEDGTFDPASAGTPFDYQGKQDGWYMQGIYQFMPRWRAGLRFDRLKADNRGAVTGTALDDQGHQPKRASAMVDFSNSEFSRLRLQYNRDESRAQVTDRQWYLQYIMSLGAHGAHTF